MRRIDVYIYNLLGLAVFALAACGDANPDTIGNSAGPVETRAHSSTPPSELRAALDDAFAARSRFERIRKLSSALDHLDAGSVDQAVQVFERENWWLVDTEIRLFMGAWTRFDPEAALDYAQRWPVGAHRAEALAAALQGFARHDPVAAERHFKALAPTHVHIRGELVDSLVTGWVESGQPGVLQHIASEPAGTWPYGAMLAAGKTTRLLGARGAIDWAEEAVASALPPQLKQQIFQRVTGMAARSDPVAVAAFVRKHAGQPHADRSARLLAERWVTQDPDAATGWVREFVPPEEQFAVLRTAYAKWLVERFEEASAWIEAIPAEAKSDAAYAAFARILGPLDPERALSFADRLEDEARRLSVLERAAGRWYGRDKEAAEAWLEQSPLDEPARERARDTSMRKRRGRLPLEGL